MPQFRFNTISRTEIEESAGGAQMLTAIDYSGNHHILVTGPPGSGKTTISLMRAERLIASGKTVLVLTHHDLLWRSLRNIASAGLRPNISKFYSWWARNFGYLYPYQKEDHMINTTLSWNGVDEIIIDEGQDFEARIFRTLLTKCKRLAVGADNAQKVYSNGLSSSQIKNELGNKEEPLHISLGYNYRNTFGIYDFARHFLPDNEIVNNKLTIEKITKGDGSKPTLFLIPDTNTLASQLKILLTNAGDRNIAVLLFGIEEVDHYASLIQTLGFPCSKHHHDDHIGSEIENILVTTLQSAKGLEFQVVIMPNMETARNEPYKSEQHYFVACTRAKESLFLMALCNVVPNCMAHFETKSYDVITVPKIAPPFEAKSDETEVDLPF